MLLIVKLAPSSYPPYPIEPLSDHNQRQFLSKNPRHYRAPHLIDNGERITDQPQMAMLGKPIISIDCPSLR